MKADETTDILAQIYTEELSKVKIKGVNTRLVVRLLSEAHPRRFKYLAGYLKYCGYTNEARTTKKYNREAKSMAFLMAVEVKNLFNRIEINDV